MFPGNTGNRRGVPAAWEGTGVHGHNYKFERLAAPGFSKMDKFIISTHQTKWVPVHVLNAYEAAVQGFFPRITCPT